MLSESKIRWMWSEAHNDTSDRMAYQVLAAMVEAEVRKQDDALIQQMKEVLESLAGVKLADGSYADKDCGFTLAITAAKLRLGD